jgi:hypothetical protein
MKVRLLTSVKGAKATPPQIPNATISLAPPWTRITKLAKQRLDRCITSPFRFRSMDANGRFWTDPDRVA